MNEYTYSIVIPAYNAEKFISLCLDSVRKQTYLKYEVIVVNDGSKDSTEQVINNYQKQFPQFPLKYVRQENGGAAKARGTAIELAAMDYIAFLDADDIWYENKLQKVNAVLNRENADVLYHDEYEISLNGEKKIRKYRQLMNDSLDDLIINGNALSTSTVVVERNILLKSNTFKAGKRAGEDIECWIQLAKNRAVFYHIPEVLGEYRREENSLTLRSIQYMRETDEMLLTFYDLLDSNKYSDKEIATLKNRRQSQNYYNCARYYHMGGDFEKAIDFYKKAKDLESKMYKAYIGMFLSYVKVKR